MCARVYVRVGVCVSVCVCVCVSPYSALIARFEVYLLYVTEATRHARGPHDKELVLCVCTEWPVHLHRLGINPFTAPTCKISGLKDARTRLKNSIFSGPITHLLSMPRVLMKAFSHASAKKKKKKKKA